MGHINMGKVIAGGLIAGLIINVFEYVANTFVLADDWQAVMTSLNRPATMPTEAIIGFVIWGFLMGLAAVWLYAAIRPRFGPGPQTAIKAGLFVWAIGYVLASTAPLLLGIIPGRLLAIGMVIGLIEVLVATVVGAAIYQEGAAPAEELRARTARA